MIVTVIVRTSGVAKCLRSTLDSLKGQPWGDGDRIVVVADGHQPDALQVWQEYGLRGYYTEQMPAMELLAGGRAVQLDEGQELLPNQVAFIRKGLQVSRLQPVSAPLAFNVCGTDKESKHRYGTMYAELFSGREKKVSAVLELGVLRGESIRAWSMIFPYAELVGVDVADHADAIAGVSQASFVRMDLGDDAALDGFAAANVGRFDLIVDDASHIPYHQFRALDRLRRCLKPDGAYVVEDIGDDQTWESLVDRGGVGTDLRRHTGFFDSRAVVFRGPGRGAITCARPGRPRVLFASHYLKRDGAPIYLHHLVTAIRSVDPVLFSWHSGPLSEDYARCGVRVTHDFDLAGVDLVYANTLVAEPAIRVAAAAGVPSVWLIQESDPAMCGNLEAVREAIALPRLVIFTSQATADAYASLRSENVRVIPGVIPPAAPLRDRGACRAARGIEPDEFVVLSFGREGDARKGQEDIRAAVDLFVGRGHRMRLCLIADDPDPWGWLAAADLYVCSSRVEAFPLSIQEAKLAGLPVITTPVFGCRDIIRHGVDGLHYRPGDVSDLAEKIAQVTRDRGLYRNDRPTHLPSWGEVVSRHEAAIGDALGGLFDPQPVDVVYHVAGMGGWWRSIVDEQLRQLAAAGLRRVYVTHVGEDVDWVADRARAVGIDALVCESTPDVTRWENPAMEFVERLSRHSSRPIIYIHSKGVTHDPIAEPWFHEWRRLMMREVVGRWRENLAHLRDHDAVGVNWWTHQEEKNHFSGNFWMVRPEWIRKLVPFRKYYRDRFSAERWIGSTPGCRVRSLVCTDRKFWDVDLQWMMEACAR